MSRRHPISVVVLASFWLSSCALTPVDWTGAVCESPVYKDIIGTFTGELTSPSGGGACVWDTTVVISGENSDQICKLAGTIESTIVTDQGVTGYKCVEGNREVTFSNGLTAGDDLNRLRPASIGFHYRPTLEEKDSEGKNLVHAITQFEHVTVDYDGLMATSGLLKRQK